MTTLARLLSGLSGVNVDVETFKTLIIFCGFGLLISLACTMALGLDLGAGFF